MLTKPTLSTIPRMLNITVGSRCHVDWLPFSHPHYQRQKYISNDSGWYMPVDWQLRHNEIQLLQKKICAQRMTRAGRRGQRKMKHLMHLISKIHRTNFDDWVARNCVGCRDSFHLSEWQLARDGTHCIAGNNAADLKIKNGRKTVAAANAIAVAAVSYQSNRHVLLPILSTFVNIRAQATRIELRLSNEQRHLSMLDIGKYVRAHAHTQMICTRKIY